MTGDVSEILTVWQIRRNFLIFMLQLSVSSLCFYTINLNMKNVQGTLLVNTMSSQVAELSAVIISGFIFSLVGPRIALFTSYLICVFGSLCLIYIKSGGKVEVDPF